MLEPFRSGMRSSSNRGRRARAGGFARRCWGALVLSVTGIVSWGPEAYAGQPASATELLGARLVQGYIQPAMVRFADAGAQMRAELEGFCAQSEPQRATAAHARYRELVYAWSGIAFLRFGPLVEANRYEKIFFWPDPRGVILRQTQAAIGRQDAGLLAPSALRAASVAVQGLPSLEYALYGGAEALLAAPSAGGDYRCRYAVAVAGNLADLGMELAAAWSEQGAAARQFRWPDAANPVYRSESEVTAEALKALSSGLQFIRDAQLTPALGAAPKSARVGRMPLVRSELALPAMSASLRAMSAFAAAGDFARLLPSDQQWLAQVLIQSPLEPAARLQSVSLPAEQALTDPETRALLTGVAVALGDLTEMVNGQIANALGVSVGFNALDGD